MTRFLFIPYVNGADLHAQALESLYSSEWDKILVIDNSKNGDYVTQSVIHHRNVEVFTPPVPMTFTQTQNYALLEAMKGGYDYYVFAHNDAFYKGKADNLIKLMDKTFKRKDNNTAVAFTNYDVIAGFNTHLVYKVGYWDTYIQWYYADNDYYRRVRLAGYEIAELGGDDVEHRNDASNTLKNDKYRSAINGYTFNLAGQYYRMKWGGEPNDERFLVPFNNTLLADMSKV